MYYLQVREVVNLLQLTTKSPPHAPFFSHAFSVQALAPATWTQTWPCPSKRGARRWSSCWGRQQGSNQPRPARWSTERCWLWRIFTFFGRWISVVTATLMGRMGFDIWSRKLSWMIYSAELWGAQFVAVWYSSRADSLTPIASQEHQSQEVCSDWAMNQLERCIEVNGMYSE